MGPPPPPKPKQTRDSTFMEKLNAVDEELAASPVCMDSFQVSIAIELREGSGAGGKSSFLCRCHAVVCL